MADVVGSGPFDVRVGVLLEPAGLGRDDIDEDGYAPASGYRGEHRGRRMALVGDEVLRAAATAVGNQVAVVLTGIVAGLERQPDGPAVRVGGLETTDVQLKFGVKAVLGAGKAVEALLSASGEATVEVAVTLRQRPTGS